MIHPADPTALLPLPCLPPGTPSGLSAAVQRARHDAELVRRSLSGDDSAFDEIVSRHRAMIHAVALGVIHNQADAEELTQDTFIRAHRGLARFRGDASLATWLHRIALNLARNRYWYFFRRRRHATLSLDCPLREGDEATFTDLVADEGPGPERAIMTEEFMGLVAGCVARLGAQSREILRLRHQGDLSYDEISVRLGINPGTVKSRLGRAREALRALLVLACPEIGADESLGSWFGPVRSATGA